VHGDETDLGNGVCCVRQDLSRDLLGQVLGGTQHHDPLVAEQRGAEHLDEVTRLQCAAVELGDLGLGVAHAGGADDGGDGP